MAKKNTLPKGVYLKHGAYYFVRRPIGQKNKKWTRLCSEKEGEVGLYQALASFKRTEINCPMTMARLIDEYLNNEFIPKNQKATPEKTKVAISNVVYRLNGIKKAIGPNLVADVTSKLLKDFLEQEFMPSLVPGQTMAERAAKQKNEDKPRTFNAYRTMLRNLFRYAESMNYRPVGSNPVPSIVEQPKNVRSRYVTDSEMRRIKQALCRGEDGQRTRIGTTISCLLDLAYLTGQRQEDLRELEWKDITPEGIQFKPSKTAAKTGARILIEWTPKLRQVIARLQSLPKHHIRKVFTNDLARPLTKNNCTSAWSRAMARCTERGTLPLENRPQFRDLRRKSLTEVARAQGRGLDEAQSMGAHANLRQTIDYISSPDIFITNKTKAAR